MAASWLQLLLSLRLCLHRRPRRIAREVVSWLKDPQKLANLRANALEAARPEATMQIAREIAEMIGVGTQQEH